MVNIKILISNDDGVHAKGLQALISALRPIADLTVVAPDGPRSGASCSITSTRPLTCDKLQEEDGLVVWKCSGTPLDCVKLGLDQIMTSRPDMVVAGINHGDNSSVNVHYSGTMGAVIEACLKRIPSVGFSLCTFDPQADFSACLPFIRNIVLKALDKGLPEWTCLNVNFPTCSQFKGVKICRQTKAVWIKEFDKRRHPFGKDYWWMTGEFLNEEPFSVDSDQWALNNGYVAITPVMTDMTDYSLLEEMKGWGL